MDNDVWHIPYRDRKPMEMDFPPTANCFGHIFIQRMLYYTEEAQENMLKLGNTFLHINFKTLQNNHNSSTNYK